MLRTLALAGALMFGCGAAAPYYGTTCCGGDNGAGSVYAFTRGAHPVRRTLYSFCARENCIDGGYPLGNLIVLRDGSIIGTTSSGGRGAGTIFRLTPAPNGTWAESTLLDFCLCWDQCARFGRPSGTLTLVGPHRIVGSNSDTDGRGAVWVFSWGTWGEEFSPLQYWTGRRR